MLLIRSILLLALPAISICAAHNPPRRLRGDERLIKELIEWLPEDAVRSAIQESHLPKYRDGVFEHGKKAIEAIQNESPEFATRLLDKALHKEIEKQDLRKRQNNSTSTEDPTSTSEPPPDSTTPPPDSTTPPTSNSPDPTTPPDPTTQPPNTPSSSDGK